MNRRGRGRARVVAFLGSDARRGANPRRSPGAVEGYDVSEDLWLLEDANSSLTIDDVEKPDVAARFARTTQRYPTLGLSASAYWVRLELHNESDERQERLLEIVRGTLDEVEVHFPVGSEPRVLRTRRHAPFSERPYAHRYPVFPVTLEPRSRTTLHVRVASESELYFPMRIWSHEGLRKKDLLQDRTPRRRRRCEASPRGFRGH